MRTRSRAGWLLALLPAVALADTAGTNFQVGATVVPRTSVAPIAAPAQVQVTARDLALGYVDVAATYRVASNDPRGYLLKFATRTGLTRTIDVGGLAAPLTLSDAGAEVHQAVRTGAHDVALRYRLHLAPQAREGIYPLPVLVVARSL